MGGQEMPAGLLALKMKIRSSCHLLWASLVLINHFPSVPSARINGQWTEIRTREFDSQQWLGTDRTDNETYFKSDAREFSGRGDQEYVFPLLMASQFVTRHGQHYPHTHCTALLASPSAVSLLLGCSRRGPPRVGEVINMNYVSTRIPLRTATRIDMKTNVHCVRNRQSGQWWAPFEPGRTTQREYLGPDPIWDTRRRK